jgi:hypothetical protein
MNSEDSVQMDAELFLEMETVSQNEEKRIRI